MSKISVTLTGGKSTFSSGREQPMVATIITCPHAHDCSFYKEKTCLAISTGVFATNCKFASKEKVQGYTSRAKKYHEFREKWVNDKFYNYLKAAPRKLGIANDVVIFPYPYIAILHNLQTNEVKIEPAYRQNGHSYIPIDLFTVDLIHDILTYKAASMSGYEIKDYQEKVVSKILVDLKKLLPSLYKQLIKKYPKHDIQKKEMNYVGRKAYLYSINPGIVEYILDKNEVKETWEWDGVYLTLKEMKNRPYVGLLNSSQYEVDTFKYVIKPKPDVVIKITNNNQVNEDTKFVD